NKKISACSLAVHYQDYSFHYISASKAGGDNSVIAFTASAVNPSSRHTVVSTHQPSQWRLSRLNYCSSHAYSRRAKAFQCPLLGCITTTASLKTHIVQWAYISSSY